MGYDDVKLVVYETPAALERAVVAFVDYYNYLRYHEGIANVTPADIYYGRRDEILAKRKEVKQRTLQQRRDYNRANQGESPPPKWPLVKGPKSPKVADDVHSAVAL